MLRVIFDTFINIGRDSEAKTRGGKAVNTPLLDMQRGPILDSALSLCLWDSCSIGKTRTPTMWSFYSMCKPGDGLRNPPL